MVWLVSRWLGRGTEMRSPRGAGVRRFTPRLEVLDGRALPSAGLFTGVELTGGINGGVLKAGHPGDEPAQVGALGGRVDPLGVDGTYVSLRTRGSTEEIPAPTGSPGAGGGAGSSVPSMTQGTWEVSPDHHDPIGEEIPQ